MVSDGFFPALGNGRDMTPPMTASDGLQAAE
jgi:hypothetical protein